MTNALVLDDLIHRIGISMEAERVRSNPILTDEDAASAVEHFKFKLSRPGKKLDVYLSLDSDEMDDAPSVGDVLLMLAIDASGCQMLEGYETRNRELAAMLGGSDGNLREIEDFWKEYHARYTQTQEVRRFLGESAYDELLYHFML